MAEQRIGQHTGNIRNLEPLHQEEAIPKGKQGGKGVIPANSENQIPPSDTQPEQTPAHQREVKASDPEATKALLQQKSSPEAVAKAQEILADNSELARCYKEVVKQNSVKHSVGVLEELLYEKKFWTEKPGKALKDFIKKANSLTKATPGLTVDIEVEGFGKVRLIPAGPQLKKLILSTEVLYDLVSKALELARRLKTSIELTPAASQNIKHRIESLVGELQKTASELSDGHQQQIHEKLTSIRNPTVHVSAKGIDLGFTPTQNVENTDEDKGIPEQEFESSIPANDYAERMRRLAQGYNRSKGTNPPVHMTEHDDARQGMPLASVLTNRNDRQPTPPNEEPPASKGSPHARKPPVHGKGSETSTPLVPANVPHALRQLMQHRAPKMQALQTKVNQLPSSSDSESLKPIEINQNEMAYLRGFFSNGSIDEQLKNTINSKFLTNIMNQAENPNRIKAAIIEGLEDFREITENDSDISEIKQNVKYHLYTAENETHADKIFESFLATPEFNSWGMKGLSTAINLTDTSNDYNRYDLDALAFCIANRVMSKFNVSQ